jgi:glycosyltransferase involved in cell wall biosynthesis
MDNPHISVAMCTYNGARFLPQQLESIAAQTRRPDQMIVCDDGSADDTLRILRHFRRTAGFPIHILENNGAPLGSTKNFEKAIRFCDGRVIFLADQDDVWKSEKIEILADTLDNHPEAGYVFSDGQLIDEPGGWLGTCIWESLGINASVIRRFSEANQVPILLRRSLVTGATMAFRSSLESVIVPIPEHFVHDYWISLLSSCIGLRGVPIPEPLVEYRQHQGQQIGARRASLFEKIRAARQTGAKYYRSRSQGLQELRSRLLIAGARGRTYSADDLNLLDQNLEHFFRRAAVHSLHGTARIGKVVSEAATGRYGKFSNSWQSIVEDLCF